MPQPEQLKWAKIIIKKEGPWFAAVFCSGNLLKILLAHEPMLWFCKYFAQKVKQILAIFSIAMSNLVFRNAKILKFF